MLHSLPKDTSFATLKELADSGETDMIAELTIGEDTILEIVEEFLIERGYTIDKGKSELVDSDDQSLASEIKFNLVIKAL